MKIYFKKLIPVIFAVSLVTGVPYLKIPGTCGLTFPIAVTGAIFGCSGEKDSGVNSDQNRKSVVTNPGNKNKTELKVTFVELGSINCIPCRMMQPVMNDIEKKYPGQVKVIFYDIWTTAGRKDGAKFNIRVIPTQVFLDKNGKEYFRHEGFFPFEEVDKILKMKGVM